MWLRSYHILYVGLFSVIIVPPLGLTLGLAKLTHGMSVLGVWWQYSQRIQIYFWDFWNFRNIIKYENILIDFKRHIDK